MILVTKCPHCQTTFRVTEDQLKLYEGAVRCGVCQQIFNGTDHLQTEPPVLTDKPAAVEKKKAAPAAPKSSPATPQDTPAKKAVVPNKPVPKPAPPQPRHEADDITLSLADEDINASSSESEALFDALEEELSTISLELGQVTGQLFGNELEEMPEIEEEEPDALTPEQPVTINEIVSDEAVYTKPPAPAATTRFGNLSPYPDLGAPAKNTVYSTAPRLDDVAEVAPSTSIEAEVVEPDDPAILRHQRSQRLSSQNREFDPLMDTADSHHAAFFELAEEDDTDDNLYNEPSFVTKGRRKKRTGLFSGTFVTLATIALLGALGVQCLYMFSDRIVVWWPPAESAVAKACDMFACPRRLETRISSLSIESSELQVIPELGDRYTLSLLVRNSGSSYQSWPHIELTLMDQGKKPVVRRAFSPANYLPDANRIIRGIPPYSEESVKLYLEMKTEFNADYRIALFYP
ncbi:MAG: DUF3426 domain-containing protein [Oxalobacter sp.]|nr:DUF3426 domain-containing protein [Oxalobacter sp.]